MKRLHLKTELRKEQIAAAVLNILCTEGMAGLTADKVAQAVGVVPSALYRHYSGKMAMLEAGVELLGERMTARLQAQCEGKTDALEILRGILQELIGMIHEIQAVPRILFADETMRGDSGYKAIVLRLQLRMIGIVRQYIEIGQAQKIIRADIAADKLSIAFMGMFVPAAVLYHASNGAIDIQDTIAANWQFFLSGIAPQSGSTFLAVS